MAITEDRVVELLREQNALLAGHFLFSSGLHGSNYVQCQKILQYPRWGMMLAEAMAEKIKESGLVPQSVVGPALGAVHWEVMVAAALDRAQPKEPIKAIFAERPAESNDFEIRRGIHIAPGERVLVVEDVITTGGSARKVIELVRRLGGDPIAVGTIVDRSGGTAAFDVPVLSLLRLNMEQFDQEDCRLCKNGIPLVKPGSTRTAAG